MVFPGSSITSEQRQACRDALRDLFGRDDLEIVPEDEEESSMSGWGIVGQQALETGRDVGMAYLNDMFSARQAARGYKYWRKSLRKGPGYQVEGLRRAGLNPILAAGGMQMGGSAFAPVHSARVVGSSGKGPGMLEYVQMQNIRAQTDKTAAEASLARAEADAVAKFGLGARRPMGKWIDSLIEIFDPSSQQWSAKGGTPASRLKALQQRAKQNVDYWRGKRGKTYRYRLPPDTGRSGYEQHLTRIK